MSVQAYILNQPLLLFDGYCNLCNLSVIAIIKRDQQEIFRFASLQSDFGQTLLAQYQLDQDDIDSVVLIYDGEARVKSDAVLGVMGLLGGWYRLLLIGRILPLLLRNWIYNWVVKKRYAWFGKKETCMIPTPELESRFID